MNVPSTPPAMPPLPAHSSAEWLAAPSDFTLAWGAATDVGLVRRNNEDALRIEHNAALAFLADGMGGYNAGEIASHMAVNSACEQVLTALAQAREQISLHPEMGRRHSETPKAGPEAAALAVSDLARLPGRGRPEGAALVEQVLRASRESTHPPDEALGRQAICQTLDQAQWRAHYRVLQHARSDAALQGMGTTLAGIWLRRDRIFITHVGDSRVYRWRPLPTAQRPNWGELNQLTRDHTVLQEQIDAGLPIHDQYGHPASRNVLTRALGIDGAFGPETRSMVVHPGDLYLICSDGLTDALHDKQIAALCAQNSPVQSIAEELVRSANEQGGRDNVTVITLRVTLTQ